MLARFFLEWGLPDFSPIVLEKTAFRNYPRGLTNPLKAPSATEKNEVVITMKHPCLSKIALLSALMAGGLSSAVAQNSILLLNDSLIEPTSNTTSPSNPYVFQSTIQELNCQATPIYANISSSPSAVNYSNHMIVVLDNIQVTVTPSGGSTTGPVNVCPSQNGFAAACFNPATVGVHGQLSQYVGQDPDNTIPGSNPAQTFYQVYGVPDVQIGSMLSQGQQSVVFQLENDLPAAQSDTGNTTLYLNTNCTSTGVSGPATVINNPPPGNPTNPVTETFVFNNGNNQGINFQYTLPPDVGDLTGLTEHVSDMPVDPAAFDSNYTYGTSFSTTNCYLHAGELLNNNPACKMYTLLCSQGTNPTETGALCPASAAADEIFGESFDPPASFTLSLPDITTPGGTYHSGVGLLMGPDTWTTGSSNGCEYTAGSIAAEQNQMCPQNLLYNFFGPGASNSQGRGDNVNSTFITVYGVPEPLTTVTMTDQFGNPVGVGPANGNWTNNSSPYVQLSSTPPLGVAATAAGIASNFIPAPIQDIYYGLTTPGGTVPQPASEPINSDLALAAATCPTVGYTGTPPATVFTPAPVQMSLNSGDGNYTLHYYAQDCAGTQELQFLLNSQVNPPSWYTTFYTYPINLDTVAPTVSAPTLSPAGGSYAFGQSVTANFSCSDSESGLASCGGTTYTLSNGTGAAASGALSAPVSTVHLYRDGYRLCRQYFVTVGELHGWSGIANHYRLYVAGAVSLCATDGWDSAERDWWCFGQSGDVCGACRTGHDCLHARLRADDHWYWNGDGVCQPTG